MPVLPSYSQTELISLGDRQTMDQAERDFLRTYDPRAFAPVAVTADVVALTVREGALCVLLITRPDHPFKGWAALPGGFVGGSEDLHEVAARKLAEKTGLVASATPSRVKRALARVHLEQLRSYGAPGRDPRMRVVSVAYLAFAPDLPAPGNGASWVPVGEVGRLAFDHARILADGLDRARAKLEYTPLATSFVGPGFTISELRSVYETVWGERLHAGNFHRKVLSVPGFVESVGQTTERGGARGGPRARLYRRGDAQLLYPPLLRPGTEAEVR